MHGLRVMARVWVVFFKKIINMTPLKGINKLTKYIPYILNMSIFLFVTLYLYIEIIFPFIGDLSKGNQYNNSILFLMLIAFCVLFVVLFFKFSESVAEIQEEESRKE